MSWDVTMRDENGKVLPCERFEDGGTYAMGGATECDLNVTYNYNTIIREFCGIEFGDFSGKTGAEVEPILNNAVARMAIVPDEDYWKPTEGNVRAALCRLLAWSRAYPDGKFDVH